MTAQEATVLVTPRSFGRHDPSLVAELERSVRQVVHRPGAELARDELQRLVADVDGWIAGVERIDREVIEAAPRLKVIARYGVGVDNVDLEAARERGVIVTNTPGANSAAVAELALALMLALARDVLDASLRVRAGEWPRVEGRQLAGATVGVIGFGAIGRELAWRARALGAAVVAHDPLPDRAFAAEHGIELTTSLDELLPRADFVSLHVPALPDTVGLVDSAFLGRLKRGAILVNTSRGDVVDEVALAEALRDDRLGGAALDALSEEPAGANHPLLGLPRVIVTPHIGAHTDAAVTAMGRGALENLLAVLSGSPPPTPVRPVELRAQEAK